MKVLMAGLRREHNGGVSLLPPLQISCSPWQRTRSTAVAALGPRLQPTVAVGRRWVASRARAAAPGAARSSGSTTGTWAGWLGAVPKVPATDLGSEGVTLGSEGVDLGSKSADLGSERRNLGSEHHDLGSEHHDSGNLCCLCPEVRSAFVLGTQM